MKNYGKSGNNLPRAFLFASIAVATMLLTLVLSIADDASEEYKYTVEVVFQIAFPICVIGSIISFLFCVGRAGVKELLDFKSKMIHFFVLGLILVYIPVLSPDALFIDWKYGLAYSVCWLLGTLSLAIGIFALAARIHGVFSGLLCLVASLFLAFSVCEFAFLCTSQTMDGRFVATERSKYVKSGEAAAVLPHGQGYIGAYPKRPDTHNGSFAHCEWRHNNIIYDVKYTFNEHNRRIMPAADANPKADLLIFGCSFTFGHGLENEQTWPYQLARLLGPAWKVENYGQNGYGVQQMLGMIESKAIVAPKAPVRQALFLSIFDQIRRNSGLFLMNSISYKLEDGHLTQGPYTDESKLRILFRLPKIFNGSQFVRETCRMVMYKLAAIMNPKHTELYIAMIVEAARLLREEYQTTLTVLLWPDNEAVAPALREKGIHVLFARSMLKEWGEGDSPNYHIVPHLESHPNEKATAEIARGLAQYYEKMTQ